MTAVLSWHVQNFRWSVGQDRNEIYTKVELQWENCWWNGPRRGFNAANTGPMQARYVMLMECQSYNDIVMWHGNTPHFTGLCAGNQQMDSMHKGPVMESSDGLFVISQLSRGVAIMSSNGNIFRVTGHLCGEFNGPRWIPHTKASDAELWCLLWSVPE